MKIVGVSACAVGIAHTYLAQEKLMTAASKKGDEIKIETQGTIGTENELTDSDIKSADAILLAVDVNINKDRFGNKRMIEVPTDMAIKSPNKLIEKIHEVIDGN